MIALHLLLWEKREIGLGARAFTYGNHILFDLRGSSAASRLLAHELTHSADQPSWSQSRDFRIGRRLRASGLW